MEVSEKAGASILILCIFTIMTGDLQAQHRPVVNAHFLEAESHPRSLALGQATVALGGYAGAGHLNPAGIGMQGFVEGGTNISALDGEPLRLLHPDYIDGAWRSTASAAYRLGRIAAELRWQAYWSDQGPFFTPSRERFNIRVRRRALSATAAYRVSNGLRLGIGLNHIQMKDQRDLAAGDDRTAGMQNLSVDLGLQYNTGIIDLGLARMHSSAGWSLTDVGPTFRMSSINLAEQQKVHYALPITMRVGTSIKIALNEYWHQRPLASLSFNGALSHLLARSEDDGTPYGPLRALVNSWGPYTNFDGSEIPFHKQVNTHLGYELSLVELLYIRVGRVNRQTQGAVFDLSSYGFGLDLYYLAVDYARLNPTGEVVNQDLFEPVNVWQVTACVPLNGDDGRNFWPDLLGNIFN